MPSPIVVTIAHQLGRAEARRRIEDGFASIVHSLPGHAAARSHRWDGDTLTFSIAAMGQAVAGVIEVLESEVKMQIDLPGVLGILAGALKDRLQKVGQRLLTKS